MTGVQVINGRYEVKDPPIGQGGMGVVYKAYDSITKRYVALKTMWGVVESGAIELFEREWTVLARLSHPNIVDILDTGEFQEDGQRRPYFVMPLLPGVTLDHLIKSSSQRLTVERTVEIMSQACRGLQAAHDQGLVHRDLKPSNIFVMDDDTVKIIDFGVVHLADTRSVTGIKGTLQYMAPEQLEMKPATPLSDIFSLGVVCYEALTGRKPFSRKTETEVADAIRTYIPPPTSEINASVNQLLSRTVHKAMAKQPWHRFSNAREFSETMQKALRNEPIERFDRNKIQPRIDRIRKAFNEGDYQFSMEILTELESEGHIDPDMSVLRIQIEQAVRQKTIRQLIESARTRMEEDEFPLALQKIQDVLNIDPSNVDALSIRSQIERQRSEKQVDNWFRLVREHVDNQLYSQARQGIQEILKINNSDARARELLAEIDRTEQEFIKVREEKQKLYQAALASYQNGEISSALSKLERVLDLTRRMPKTVTPEREAQYQSLYNQIRSERDAARNAYAEGRKNLADRNFARTLEICNEFLQRQPGDPLFQALKIEAEELERQEQSAAIADVNRRVEAEADLDKKVNIIKEAVEKYPNEPHFKQSLKLVRDRRDLVNSIVTRARQYEERGQFNDAAGQWDILRNIYSQYPGLDFEVQRLARRREEQAKEETKSRWVEKVDRHLGAGEYLKAREVVKEALEEFPEDRELQGLDKLAEQALRRSDEATVLLKEGQALCADRKYPEGLATLRKAEQLDDRNPIIRATLLSALLDHARAQLSQDWHQAEPLVEQALELDSGDPVARSLSSLLQDYRRQEVVGQYVLEARGLQAAGELQGALRKVEDGLGAYPNEIRLSQLHATLRTALTEARKTEVRTKRPVEEPPSAPQAGVSAPPVAARSDAPPPIETLFQPASSQTSPSKAPTPPAASQAPPLQAGASAPVVPPPPKAVTPPAPPVKTPPPPKPAAQQPASRQSGPPKKLPTMWVAVVAGVVVIAAALIYVALKPHSGAGGSGIDKKGAPIAVNLSADVPNAKFTVDGQPASSSSLTLAPGEHHAEAMLDGYKTDSKTFSISPDTQGAFQVSFHLESVRPELRISSDLKTGKFVFDNAPPADLQDGDLTKNDLTPGDHNIKLLDGTREVLSFTFHVEPKQMITLTAPITSKGTPGVVVSSLGSDAKVYGTPGLKGGLANQPLLPIPADGMTLSGISPNNAQFMVDDGKGQLRPVALEPKGTPTLSVSLNNTSDQVRVAIATNVPNGIVVVNGTQLKRPMADGTRSLLLGPGKYRIKVTHPDYEDSTEQAIEIKAGDTNPPPSLTFTLKAIASKAILAIDSAPPSADILIDGARAGTVNASGSFTTEVTPGSHVIVLHKQGYEDYTATQEFKAGETRKISGGLNAFGSLAFKASPANARVSYRRDGEQQAQESPNGQTISLRAGNYEITVQADKFISKTQTVTVGPGKAVVIDWALPSAPKQQAESLSPAGIFENGYSWKVASDGWWTHAAPGYSFIRNPEGTIIFEILKQSKRGVFGSKAKKIVFVANYKSEKNRILYTLDEHQLHRKIYSESGDGDEVKVAHGMDSGQTYRLIVELTPDRVVIRNRAGKLLDDSKSSGGKFGFSDDLQLVVVPQK
jgi:serine/threonine-protein kinase